MSDDDFNFLKDVFLTPDWDHDGDVDIRDALLFDDMDEFEKNPYDGTDCTTDCGSHFDDFGGYDDGCGNFDGTGDCGDY